MNSNTLTLQLKKVFSDIDKAICPGQIIRVKLTQIKVKNT